LLDQNDRNFSDEEVAKQMNNLFYGLQGTLAQEKHQAEKFFTTAKVAAQNDLHLNADQASDTITAALTAHERKFEEIQQKWESWQNRRQIIRTSLQTVEEIKTWQIDTSECIASLERRGENAGEREDVLRAINVLPIQEQSRRLDEAAKVIREQQSKFILNKKRLLL
jgi:hypothetical protein